MSKSKIVTLVLTAACMLLGGCGGTAEDQNIIETELILPEEVNYTTVQAEKAEYIRNGQGGASLEHPVAVNLYCEINGARMQEVLVSKGDKVAAGDTLVVFDLEQYETDLEELKLKVTRIRQELNTESQKMLQEIEVAKGETGWLSVNDAELASLRIEKQQVEYEQYVYQTNRQIRLLNEQIAELEELAQNDTLVAPYDGVIYSITSYKEGEKINLSKPVINMYSEDTILLASDDTGKLRYNMPVTITTGAKNNQQVLEGRVVSAPNILPSTVEQDYVLIQVAPDVSGEVFQRGISYTCELEKLQDVLMVNSRAVEKEDGKSYVYVLEDDMVKKRYVKAGLSSTESTWILDGLSEEQTLILDY